MSHVSSLRSHAMTWIASVLAVLLLYAATWPVVEIKTTYIVDWTHGIFHARPKWVDRLYGPMQYLSSLNGGRNPLTLYHEWWEKWLPLKDPTVIHSR